MLASVLACPLIVAGGARAAVVTVGSPLTVTANGTSVCSPSCIFANQVLAEPGANVTSPVDGVIVRWRTSGPYTGGPFRLRVLTPVAGGQYLANGTSDPQMPSGPGVQAFATNLPIRAGDLIGLEESAGSGIARRSLVTGSTTFAFNPALADGTSAAPSAGPFPGFEALFNADVATAPDNHFSFGALTRDKRRGTAVLTAIVPGPGELTVGGSGVVAASQAGKAVHAGGAGAVELPIQAQGKKRRKLKRKGKVSVDVSVTYTPSGDLPGTPNAQTTSVKLIKKRKPR